MISMSEPAKHCYRAIANFCRFATRQHSSSQSSLSSGHKSGARGSAGFAMTEIPDSSLPPNSFSTQSTQSFVPPPSLAPLTLAEPLSTTPASEGISLENPGTDHTPKSKPSFRKAFSFLSNSQRSQGSSDVYPEGLPRSGAHTPSDRDLTQSREDSDADGYVDSPVQENLPEAGPSDPILDPNFPSDEIKVPADIPEGSAGNSKIYAVSTFRFALAEGFPAYALCRMNDSHL